MSHLGGSAVDRGEWAPLMERPSIPCRIKESAQVTKHATTITHDTLLRDEIRLDLLRS